MCEFAGLIKEIYRPGITDDEGAENGTDTGSGSGDTDCSGTSTNELGCRVNVTVGRAGLQSTGLVKGQLSDGGPLGKAQASAGQQGQSEKYIAISFTSFRWKS